MINLSEEEIPPITIALAHRLVIASKRVPEVLSKRQGIQRSIGYCIHVGMSKYIESHCEHTSNTLEQSQELLTVWGVAPELVVEEHTGGWIEELNALLPGLMRRCAHAVNDRNIVNLKFQMNKKDHDGMNAWPTH